MNSQDMLSHMQVEPSQDLKRTRVYVIQKVFTHGLCIETISTLSTKQTVCCCDRSRPLAMAISSKNGRIISKVGKSMNLLSLIVGAKRMVMLMEKFTLRKTMLP